MIGITAWGAYIPRMRLQRKAMADANAWFDASLRGLGKGERSVCNWDEDTITMAVAAGRDCIGTDSGANISTLYLASTTFPFLDRQNSVVVGEAMNLGEQLHSMDIGGSQRAGTSALLSLLASARAEETNLLIASEHRRTKAGSRQEMLWGDAAAAIAIGQENVLAEFVASHTVAVDFVDHYRGEDATLNYDWEERWVRDEGYLKSMPQAMAALLEKAQIKAEDITHLVIPCDQPRTPPLVAKKMGISPEVLADNLIPVCGVSGVAHPILLLAQALENANSGDLIAVMGFGQGCDALLFRVTDNIGKHKPQRGVDGCLAAGRVDENYNRFLSFNQLVEREIGKRGEVDRQTFLSALNRKKKLLTGFIGGKCRECGTVQIPMEKYCVNPQCGALESQDDHLFSNATGTVKTWTADRLTFDWNPPAYFGMVEFKGGGRMMMDFSDVEEGKIDIGTEVAVQFRIRQFDSQRGFRKYFWKAIPD